MSNNPVIRILSVDDHPLLRQGIAMLIKRQADMELVAEASSGREAIDLYRQLQPHVALVDLRLPDMSGVDVISAIRTEFRDARLIVLTTFEGDAEASRALKAGASSYLLKSMPPGELVESIRLVHAGKKRLPSVVAAQIAEYLSDDALSEREIQVLRHVVEGNRNRDIAEILSISEETVKIHIRHIMEKLGANDRTQAVAIAVHRGIIHL